MRLSDALRCASLGPSDADVLKSVVGWTRSKRGEGGREGDRGTGAQSGRETERERGRESACMRA